MDGHLVASPMTDVDTLGTSNGSIKNATILSAKTGAVEKGGLFDLAVTGGITGNRWSHYKLAHNLRLNRHGRRQYLCRLGRYPSYRQR